MTTTDTITEPPVGRAKESTKHEVRRELYDPNQREAIQVMLNQDHVGFLTRFSYRHGIHYTSARHFLTQAGYTVPSKRQKRKPAQQILKLEEDPPKTLRDALASAVNKFPECNPTKAPALILADFLAGCLDTFNKTTGATFER